MFGFRKRDDGFEWREYVRTTILARRAARRRHLDEAKAAALLGAKQAGQHGVRAAQGSANALARGIASFAAWLLPILRQLVVAISAGLARAAAQTAPAASHLLERAGSILVPVLSRAMARAAVSLTPVFEFLSQPSIRLPLALVASVSGLSAAHRLWVHGPDNGALAPAAIALTGLALLVLPRLAQGDRHARRARLAYLAHAGERLAVLSGLDRLRPRQAGMLALALVAIAAAGATWLAGVGPGSPVAPARNEQTSKLEGRAIAVSGDRLRLANATVVLDGIEAPGRDQRCTRAGRRWRCGGAAKDALAGLVRGERVTCEVTSSQGPNAKTARCSVRGTDIAAELVRNGHVFAETGLFARYASLETEARSARTGLWSGEAERPAADRAKH